MSTNTLIFGGEIFMSCIVFIAFMALPSIIFIVILDYIISLKRRPEYYIYDNRFYVHRYIEDYYLEGWAIQEKLLGGEGLIPLFECEEGGQYKYLLNKLMLEGSQVKKKDFKFLMELAK